MEGSSRWTTVARYAPGRSSSPLLLLLRNNLVLDPLVLSARKNLLLHQLVLSLVRAALDNLFCIDFADTGKRLELIGCGGIDIEKISLVGSLGQRGVVKAKGSNASASRSALPQSYPEGPPYDRWQHDHPPYEIHVNDPTSAVCSRNAHNRRSTRLPFLLPTLAIWSHRTVERLERHRRIVFVERVQRVLGIILVEGIEWITRVVLVHRIRGIAGIVLIHRVQRILRIIGVDRIQRIISTVLIEGLKIL